MNHEFFDALEALAEEKRIPKEYLLEKIEAALISAFHKEYGATANARVLIDADKQEIKMYQQKEVVEVVEDPLCQISLEDAKSIAKKYKLGATVETEVKPKNFRRLSAGAAKSVFTQGIREEERKMQQEAFATKRGQIMTVTVDRVNPDDNYVTVLTNTGRATLRPEEQIPGEVLTVGQKVRVLVSDVNQEERGPVVLLTRKAPGLVRRILELDIPEIADGIVTVRGVSRDAGNRTKIAVDTTDPNVDPIGACIGPRGERINAITEELNGEKLDLVRYSDNMAEYIAAALVPATVEEVTMVEDKVASVIVRDDGLSLAIGKEGINVRLAARLTGCKIDIRPVSQAR